MIQFDRETRKRWEASGVTDIYCECIAKGCEGTTLSIHEGGVEGSEIREIKDSLVRCHMDVDTLKILEKAFVTFTKGKWILSSDNILTHCGCGKSFQAKTGDPKIDKIRLLRSKLEKRNHAHH